MATLISGWCGLSLLEWRQVHICAECDKARPDTVSVAALGFEAVMSAASWEKMKAEAAGEVVDGLRSSRKQLRSSHLTSIQPSFGVETDETRSRLKA